MTRGKLAGKTVRYRTSGNTYRVMARVTTPQDRRDLYLDPVGKTAHKPLYTTTEMLAALIATHYVEVVNGQH